MHRARTTRLPSTIARPARAEALDARARRLEDDEDDEDGEDDDEQADAKEERSSAHVFERLLKTRTIFVCRPVTDKLHEKLLTALTLLEADDPDKPVTVFVNSPGGSADSGFAMLDALRFARVPVWTVCNGICASAAVMVFLGGDAGHRFALPNSRFLLHQPSTMGQGQASDLEITAREIVKLRAQYNQIVAEQTGKSLEAVTKAADRDFWLSATEAVEYGLATRVVATRADLE